MVMPFGNYRGRLIEELLFSDPNYILWMFRKSKDCTDKNENIYQCAKYASSLIEKFDKIPFQKKCNCDETAGYCVVINGSIPKVMWLCRTCLKENSDALGVHFIINKYMSALEYVNSNFRKKTDAMTVLLTKIAESKGLPKDPISEDVIKFFEYKEQNLFELFMSDK